MKVLLCLSSRDHPIINQRFVLNYGSKSNQHSLSIQTDAEGYFDLDDALDEQPFDVTAIVNSKIQTYQVNFIKINHNSVLTLLDKHSKLAMKHPLGKSGMFGEKKMRRDDPPKSRAYVDIIECAKRGMNDALLEFIKKHQADVNEQNENGDYAVICAAQRNDLKMVKMLVEHGARLDVQDAVGRTPLGYAKKYNNSELLRFINENSAKNSYQSDVGMELQ